MFRMSLAVAVTAACLSLATGADAHVTGNGVSVNGMQPNLIPMNGRQAQGMSAPDRWGLGDAEAAAKGGGLSAAASDGKPLAVETVTLPTGAVVELR